MAYNLEIKCDSRIYVFAYINYDVLPATPTGTDLIPSGWNDIPEQQLSPTKMNVCSYSDYDFVNSRSLGNWCTPFVVTGTPLSGALDFGYNFGYSDSPFIPPSTWGKILASPTGDYMYMEKYRIINNEAFRTLDFQLINNEVESFISFYRGKIITEYEHYSESMGDRKISNCTVYSNTTDYDDNFTGKEYVEFENERYYIVQNEIKKVGLDSTNGKYKYTLSFNNEYDILKRTPFKDIGSIEAEPQFYTNQNKVFFINNITELKDRINFCLQKSYSSYGYNVVYDSGYVPNTTLYKEINAENISIFDAMKMFYDVFGVPYTIKEKQIILGFEPTITDHEFAYGSGIMDIAKSSRKDFVTTSVSGKGGQTNIPYRYPVFRDSDSNIINHPYSATYLMPTCYVESVRKKVQTQAIDYNENELIINSYEAVPNDTYINENGDSVDVEYENVVNANNYSHEFVDFPDIFPTINGVMYGGHRIDMIKSVDFDISDGRTRVSDKDDISYFYLELYPLGFDLYAHASVAEEMVLSMTSGDCSAAQFRVIGNYDLAYFNYDVYFAKQSESTTYKASHFIKFYDLLLWDSLFDAFDYPQGSGNFTNGGGSIPRPRPEQLVTIRQYINSKVINGLSVKEFIKQKIDFFNTYKTYYYSICEDAGFGGASNPIISIKAFYDNFYSNWTSFTDEQFFNAIDAMVIGLDSMQKQFRSSRLFYMKDYTDNTYPPTPPYTIGDVFVTRVRDTANYPDSTNASITLKVYKDTDTFGTPIPNKYIKPKADDTFVILGIELPDTYITNAQRRLDKALKEYLQLKNSYNANYSIKLAKKFLSENSAIYDKIRCDYKIQFYYSSNLLTKQIKKVTRKFKGVFPDIDIELYNEEDKPRTQGSRLLTMEQIASQTQITVNRTENTNRKLRIIQNTQLNKIDDRINAANSLALSKSTLFESQPKPPYSTGNYWNDDGILKRSNNGRTETESFNSSDWTVVAKTSQFLKTDDLQNINKNFEHYQYEDRVTKCFAIDGDYTLTLYNSNEYLSENILLLKNVEGSKAISLQIDFTYLVGYYIDAELPITIELDEAIQLTINYTKELIAIISVKTGLKTL